MSGSIGKTKKRKKSYYVSSSRKAKRSTLSPKDKGFLLTCNAQEWHCVRDAYNILNEYADELYGPEKEMIGSDDHLDAEDDDDDLESALEMQVKSIKRAKVLNRRFQAVDTGAKNCVFIKTDLENPTELAMKIYEDLSTKKVAKSRYILRFLPITHVCKVVNEEDVEKALSELIGSFLETWDKEKLLSYCIIFKSRCNSKLRRENFYETFVKTLILKDIEYKVDFETPDYFFVIEVIKSVCCMSFVSDYFKYRKYNIAEVVNPSIDRETDSDVTANEKQQNDLQSSVDTEAESDVTANEKDQNDLQSSVDTEAEGDVTANEKEHDLQSVESNEGLNKIISANCHKEEEKSDKIEDDE